MAADGQERRIEWMRLDDLVPAERNSRTHALDDLTGAVTSLGFTSELKVDEASGRLVWGHGRLAVLRRLRDRGAEPPEGIRDGGDDWLVPVVRGWSSRDPLHADAVREADNAQGEKGGYDDAVRLDVLADLAADRPDYLRGAGYSSADLDRLLAEATGGVDVTQLPDVTWGAAPWDRDDTPDPFDRPRPETGDDEQWDTGRTIVDPEPRRDPPAEEAPGELDRAPAFRTLHPVRAIYHAGGPEGAGAVLGWLRGHASGPRVEDGDVVVWTDRDGEWLLLPGSWVTRDGQTGAFETWTPEAFADRFVAANEPARRAMRDATPVPRSGADLLRNGRGVVSGVQTPPD